MPMRYLLSKICFLPEMEELHKKDLYMMSDKQEMEVEGLVASGDESNNGQSTSIMDSSLPEHTLPISAHEEVASAVNESIHAKDDLPESETMSIDVLNSWIEALISDDLETVKVMLGSTKNR